MSMAWSIYKHLW